MNLPRELKPFKKNIALARALGEHGSKRQQAECRCILVVDCICCKSEVGEPCRGDTGYLITTHWPRRRSAFLLKCAERRRSL